MIDEQRLNEIEARASAATEGPWAKTTDMPSFAILNLDGVRVVQSKNQPSDWHFPTNFGIASESDAEFIAHARTDVPELVAEVRRLRAECEYDQRNAAMSQEESTRLLDENERLRAALEALSDHFDETSSVGEMVSDALTLKGSDNAD